MEYRYSSTLSSTTALDGGGWSAARPDRFTPRNDPVPIVQEAGWAQGPVWTGAENLALTGIRSLDRPARSESLYRPTGNDVLVGNTGDQKGEIYLCSPTSLGTCVTALTVAYLRLGTSTRKPVASISSEILATELPAKGYENPKT